MKAIVLAGGTGSRLHPLTLGINKHLLPVGGRLMLDRVLAYVSRLGIRDVLVVSNLETLEPFGRLALHHEGPFDSVYLAAQSSPAGIAHAIRYGRTFAGSDSVLVFLADNIFSDQDIPLIQWSLRHPRPCHIFTTPTDRPESVGILQTAGSRPVRCLEKPDEGSLAITGLYQFDSSLWHHLTQISPSARGEYEITDVLNRYIDRRELSHSVLEGDWMDLGGSVPQYLQHHQLVTQRENPCIS